MTNDYYDHGSYPATGAAGTSAAMRAELDAIEAGFDKLPTLTANGGKPVFINAGATAQEAVSIPTALAALNGVVVSPSQITSNQNDYNPTSLATATVLRLSTDASRDLTGLAGGTAGRVLWVHNVGSFNLVLKDESGSSSAANRFALYADLTVLPDMLALLQYDATSSRWRVVGAQFSAFIQTLLATADAAAARTVLGLGTMALEAKTITTRGDLIRGGASGVLERVALGTAGYVATSDGTDVVWAANTHTVSAHRLTLTTAVPVTTSDVTAATTVYSTPFVGNHVLIYNGAAFLPYAVAELSLALSSNSGHTGYHQSGKNFDLFWINDAGTIRLGTGPAWSSDTARGTGAGTTELELKNGIFTNKVSMTVRFGSASGNTVSVSANQATYAGTFRCTADGQTEDSLAKRFLWNKYNRIPRPMRAVDTTDSWTYSTASTYREANGSTSNRLQFLLGLSEDEVSADVSAIVRCDGSATFANAGIGLDSTTVNSATLMAPGQFQNANVDIAVMAKYSGFPGIGSRFLSWLEHTSGGGTVTWSGDRGTSSQQSGIVGRVMA